MSPTAQTAEQPKPVINDVAGPAPMPAPSVVDNIPVHNPDQPAPHQNDDAELDKIMQDVGKEMHKGDDRPKKHHFWDVSRHHKKEANFSTQMSIRNTAAHVTAKPRPAPVAQPLAATPKPPVPIVKAPAAHTRVKPVAQKPAKTAKVPKSPKQHHAPVMVTALTILVTVALIAVAYHTYK